jgi:hypothetical protein
MKGRGYQGVEESLLVRVVGGRQFGMPLYRDEKGVVGHFQGFDGAVGGVGRDAQALADAVDGLVVPGGARRRGIAYDRGETGIFFDVDHVPGGPSRRDPMCQARTNRIGQMGDERATESHIEYLQTPAYAQGGQAVLHGAAGEGQLGVVALGVDHIDARMRRSFVVGGVEIAATG